MYTKENANALSREVIGAAIEVHKALGTMIDSLCPKG